MRTKDIADMTARWSLVLLAGLLPVFILPAAWSTPDQAKMLLACALLTIALISWLVARFLQGALFIPRSYLLAASALLPIAYLISALASRAGLVSYVSGDATQDTVAAIAVLFASLFLCAFAFGSQADVRSVTLALRALLLGAGVLFVVQWIRLAFPSWLSFNGALSGSASSLIGTWHDLGIFAGLVIIFVCLLWSSREFARGWWKIAFIASGVLAFALLIVINAADVWYLLATALLIVAVCQWGSARLREHRPHTDSLLRAAVCLIVGLLALIAAVANGALAEHLPASLQSSEPRPSWEGTFAIGEQVFHGSGFLFGSGPNTFMEAWSDFKPSSIDQTQFWDSDFGTGVGLIPTSFITVGFLGAAAWLALLCALLVRAWSVCVGERFTQARLPSVALSAGALYLCAFHIFYTPGLSISFLFFFCIGLLIALEWHEHPDPVRLSLSIHPRTALIRAVIVFAVVLALLYACINEARATVSDLFAAKATYDYDAGGTISRSLSLVEDALRWYPDNDAAHRAGVSLGLAQLQQLIAAGNTASATQLRSVLASTIQQGLQAVSINSSDYQNWLTLASLYQNLAVAGVSGAYQNALSAYQKAAAIDPANPLTLLGEAQAEEGLNDATSSIGYLDKAIALKPDLSAAYYLRSQVESNQGDLKDATTDAEQAVSLAQQDPLGWYNLGSVFYAGGDYTDAITALKRSVALQNNYADALFLLALAYDRTGDRKDALAAIEQVVQLDPQDQTAAQVSQNIRSGKPALTPAKQTADQTP